MLYFTSVSKASSLQILNMLFGVEKSFVQIFNEMWIYFYSNLFFIKRVVAVYI